MADKPADERKVSPRLAAFAASLEKGYKKADPKEREEVEAQFLKEPYSFFVAGFPCPQFSHMDPAEAGKKADFYYYPGDNVTEHTVVVLDVSGMAPVEKWRDTQVPPTGAWPHKVEIPAKHPPAAPVDVFDPGHDYMITLYPSYLGIPVGCVTWVMVTVTANLYKRLFVSAIMLQPPSAVPPLKVLKPAAGK